MAEFCKECYVKICGGNENDKFVLSRELDLCEGCGEYKQVVVRIKPKNILKRLFKFNR